MAKKDKAMMGGFPESNIEKAPSMFTNINIGGGRDISTGYYVEGKHGESLLNGGFAPITGYAGIAQAGKSTVMYHDLFTAAARVFAATDMIKIDPYDTEQTSNDARLQTYANNTTLGDITDFILDGHITPCNRATMAGEKFFSSWFKFNRDKEALMKKIDTPFIDRDGESLFQQRVDSFGTCDSLSEFGTSADQKIKDTTDVDDALRNTAPAHVGRARSQILSHLSTSCQQANARICLTAHVEPVLEISSGRKSFKKPLEDYLLPTLGGKLNIRGVSRKFFYLINNFWLLSEPKLLLNKDTGFTKYPRSTDDKHLYDPDLKIVTITQHRGKSNISGVVVPVVYSQTEGVQNTLSEWYYLNEMCKGYGIKRGGAWYTLELYPEKKFQNNSLRQLIEDDPLFCRAVEITNELAQMKNMWRPSATNNLHLHVSPSELLEKLKGKWDWNELLKTRGWWMYDNDNLDPPFLSTMDMIKMSHELYTPFWKK